MNEPEILLPQEILTEFDVVNVCAPMVRYSKLPFRELVSLYDCHITTTPMILAKEFSRSATARDSEFSTNLTERGTFYMKDSKKVEGELDDSIEKRGNNNLDRGRKIRGALMIQFAANDAVQLGDAAELVKPWVDGIDLNCGCPQKWAYQEGIGCALLRKPDIVRDLVRGVKARVGQSFPVSVKIRVDQDLSLTNELINTAIAAGADILTVHGRTRFQSSSGHPVDLDAIKFAVSCAKGQVPVIANGDVFTFEEAMSTRKHCDVKGVMSARGLLANPALFSGHEKTPWSAIEDFIRISSETGLLFVLFHRHLSYMLESHLPTKRERSYFNSLVSHAACYDFIDDFKAGLLVL